MDDPFLYVAEHGTHKSVTGYGICGYGDIAQGLTAPPGNLEEIRVK